MFVFTFSFAGVLEKGFGGAMLYGGKFWDWGSYARWESIMKIG